MRRSRELVSDTTPYVFLPLPTEIGRHLELVYASDSACLIGQLLSVLDGAAPLPVAQPELSLAPTPSSATPVPSSAVTGVPSSLTGESSTHQEADTTGYLAEKTRPLQAPRWDHHRSLHRCSNRHWRLC